MAAPLFHRAHYNIIAAQIKNQYNTTGSVQLLGNDPRHNVYLAQNRALEELAVSMAARFLEDNPSFDPLKFLNACSPDPDLYLLSELWEDYANE